MLLPQADVTTDWGQTRRHGGSESDAQAKVRRVLRIFRNLFASFVALTFPGAFKLKFALGSSSSSSARLAYDWCFASIGCVLRVPAPNLYEHHLVFWLLGAGGPS